MSGDALYVKLRGWGRETAFPLFQRELLSLNEDSFAPLHNVFQKHVSLPHLQEFEFVGIDKTGAAQIWASG